MSLAFCPKCSAPRQMNLSRSEQEVTGPDEETIKLVTETYHCAICHSFVRTESFHEPVNDQAEGKQAGRAKAHPQ
jgi:hypothetical protein